MSADGPTIYAQLMDKAIKLPHEAIVNELRGYLSATERDLAQRLHELLSEAYTEGIRDGFHEGLDAAISGESA